MSVVVNGGVVEIVASFGPFACIKVTTPGTTTVTFSVPGMSSIKGVLINVLDSGNNIKNGAVGADVTWTGNAITVADGTNFSLADTDTMYIFAWGTPKA